MSVPYERIGDILDLRRAAVALQPDREYSEIGIRSFGRGVFLKEPVSGASLGNKKVYEVRPGDLLLSNVFAWEGAVAVAGPETEGRVGSHRFMTWVPKRPDVNVHYLANFFVSEPGLEMIGRASPGSAGRNRTLGIKNFENLVVPLPDPDEQAAIVFRLERTKKWADTLERPVAAQFSKSLVRSAARALMSGLPRSLSIGTDVKVVGGGTPDKSNEASWDGGIPWVTPADLGPLRTRSISVTARTVTEFALNGGGTQPVPAGSVVMSSRAPIGHLAIAERLVATNQGCKSFVPPRGVSSAFLYFAVMASLDEIEEAAPSGTTFREVSATRLKGLRLPAANESQQDDLVRQLCRIQERAWALEAAMRTGQDLRAALVPSARNEEFARLM